MFKITMIFFLKHLALMLSFNDGNVVHHILKQFLKFWIFFCKILCMRPSYFVNFLSFMAVGVSKLFGGPGRLRGMSIINSTNCLKHHDIIGEKIQLTYDLRLFGGA